MVMVLVLLLVRADDAPMDRVRTLLDEPLFNNVSAIEGLSGRARLFDGASSQGPAAWSQRTVARGVWCSDSAQCGPLQRTISRMAATWRGERGGEAEWRVLAGPVEGIWICENFLSLAEVEMLRVLFTAQNGWSMYNWGTVGRHNGARAAPRRAAPRRAA